jgi:GTPase SAR1 family protein
VLFSLLLTISLSQKDITERASFEKVRFWIDELVANEPDCDIYIVATKCMLAAYSSLFIILSFIHPFPTRFSPGDLSESRQVSDSEVNQYAESVHAKAFHTSAKTGEGIEELFLDIAQTFLKKPSAERKRVGISPTSGSDSPKPNGNGCPC